MGRPIISAITAKYARAQCLGASPSSESETASDSACTRVWYGVGNRGGLFSAVNGGLGYLGCGTFSLGDLITLDFFSRLLGVVVFVGGLVGHRGGLLSTLDGGLVNLRGRLLSFGYFIAFDGTHAADIRAGVFRVVG